MIKYVSAEFVEMALKESIFLWIVPLNFRGFDKSQYKLSHTFPSLILSHRILSLESTFPGA